MIRRTVLVATMISLAGAIATSRLAQGNDALAIPSVAVEAPARDLQGGGLIQAGSLQ